MKINTLFGKLQMSQIIVGSDLVEFGMLGGNSCTVHFFRFKQLQKVGDESNNTPVLPSPDIDEIKSELVKSKSGV